MLLAVLVVNVVLFTVVELDDGRTVVVDLTEELDEDTDPTPPVVEPISPHRIFENTTWVFGSFARMFVGFPSVLLHGPALPLSSQSIYCPASFQMLKARTIPRPNASPMVGRPP